MATIYNAELSPSKSELLSRWLPVQPWFVGDAAALVRLGAFRFDDPAGEVGMETHVVGVGGGTYQVPLSYRSAPLAGAEDFLITTMEHSVLGRRWVYDATADPVYVRELAAALLAGKPQAAEHLVAGDALESLPVTARLSSSGTSDVELPELSIGVPRTTAGVTSIPAGPLNLVVLRELGLEELDTSVPRAAALTLTWDGRDVPALIAAAYRS
ncbi:MAG: CG0192-related protein [Specibacter sp.]